MKNFAGRTIVTIATLLAANAVVISAHADEKTFKVGIVDFLSGPGAEAFGVPSLNAAKMMIKALNEGKVPAPYNKKGIGGLPIEFIVVDEVGSAQVQIQRLRDLAQRENVDAVLGYDGSGTCLAVAPVAEELKMLTIFSGCGTPRIFEDGNYKYVFRAGGTSTMDNVSLARYTAAKLPNTKTYAGFNQNYSWGQDSWSDFNLSMSKILPNAKAGEALFPEFGSGQYGAQISALLRMKPDLIHSSLWGGDLEAFLLQAVPRELFKSSRVIYANAEHVLPRLGKKVPDGLITGARGTVGLMAPKTALSDWFSAAYLESTKEQAVQGPYRFVQAILAYKAAAEKVMTTNGGVKPKTDEVVAALENLNFETPSGKIQMALGNGHQAIQDNAVGVAMWDETQKKIVMKEVVVFRAECVNPPAGIKSADWIKAGFPGAKCD